MFVGIVNRAGHLDEHAGRRAGILDQARHLPREASSVDQLHAEEVPALVLAHFDNGHDVRVVEVGRRLGLQEEPFPLDRRGERAGKDHLQGHVAMGAPLAGPVDDPHAPPGDLLEQIIIAETLDGRGVRAPPLRVPRESISDGLAHLDIGPLANREVVSFDGPLGSINLSGRRGGRGPEDVGDGTGVVRESRVVFDGRGVIARPPAQLELERQQLDQHRRPLGVGGRAEGVFDARPTARPPVGLEALARFVDAPRPGQGERPRSLGMILRHGPSSIQILRIRSSRRATVRRAQPSRSAISSLV